MPGYQDHLLFGAVLVLVFSYFMGPFLSFTPSAMVVSAAFILLASVLPDIDHKGAIVHRKLRAFTILLVASIPATLAFPNLLFMLFGGVVSGLGVHYLFEVVKPKHRGVTHTFQFAAVFSLVAGVFSFLAFGSFLPAIFTFIAYLSHLFLDGTLGDL